jgi:hypothetical protein
MMKLKAFFDRLIRVKSSIFFPFNESTPTSHTDVAIPPNFGMKPRRKLPVALTLPVLYAAIATAFCFAILSSTLKSSTITTGFCWNNPSVAALYTVKFVSHLSRQKIPCVTLLRRILKPV